jgi:hypothetical protein
VYELDLPRVLDFKRGVLAARGDQPRTERVEIAVDLRDDWQQALGDNGFDPGEPTAFIAEGLLIREAFWCRVGSVRILFRTRALVWMSMLRYVGMSPAWAASRC